MICKCGGIMIDHYVTEKGVKVALYQRCKALFCGRIHWVYDKRETPHKRSHGLPHRIKPRFTPQP